MKSDANKEWTVLLIGGTSGIGKSSAARALAQRYSVPFLELDDLRIAAQAMVPRDALPALHAFVETPNYRETSSSEALTEKLLSVGRTLWPAIDAVISKHVHLGERVLMEGDALIPEALAPHSQQAVATVFLYDDLDTIKARQMERDRHGKAAETIDADAAFSFAYSEEIRKQAEQCGFPVLRASPIETLADRIEALLVR